jgi:phenylacetate-CoA ligase
LTLLVESRPDHAGEDARTALAGILASQIRNVIGIGIEVIVSEPGTIERSAGKARRILDLRPKQ